MTSDIFPPPIRLGEIPPFYKFGEYVFEDLCRDLLHEQAGISECYVYGKRGQSQKGIDLVAPRKNADGIDVGQCKCYESFGVRNIEKASDKFFESWAHWSEKNIKKFILFVACDVSERKCVEKFLQQKDRFKEKGIYYEAWSAAIIRNKLQPHPGIVSRYFPSKDWVRMICGRASPASLTGIEGKRSSSVVVDSILSGRVEQLASTVSSDAEKDLESMKNAWRKGHKTEAINRVNSLKGDEVRWSSLLPNVKANALCFEARIELDKNGDVTKAKKLADDARKVSPDYDQTRIRALITYKEEGPERAFHLLENHNDIDSINLKAAFLLEMGRVEESLNLLRF